VVTEKPKPDAAAVAEEQAKIAAQTEQTAKVKSAA
jgi:hypothetical protein